MSSPDLKRAPAPAWTPLATLLCSLEVGESGVLRVEVTPPPQGISPPSHWYQNPEEGWWTCGENTGQTWTPPLRPGRYWVPEEWFASRFEGDCWEVEYRPVKGAGAQRNRMVIMPTDWAPPLAYGWQSPWHLPARAARLACEVGEAEVQEWCPECEGEGDCAGPQSGWGNCPTCLGSPGPWWVYDIKRIEVSDD